MAAGVRVPDILAKKQQGELITMLTAYDFNMARLLEASGVDMLLVGDSLGMVVLGYRNTLPVTIDDVVHHSAAVARGAERALVVADMPFGTCHCGPDDAMRAAARLVQEGGAAAVKIEGGHQIADVVARLTDGGIPVMAHVGLRPQSVHQLGGFRRQARTRSDADLLLHDVKTLAEAGAFSVVLEAIPDDVAAEATTASPIPTIGIGAGPHCDGQVLVSYDVLGLYDRAVPRFAKQYAELGRHVTQAARQFVDEVTAREFPPPPEQPV